MACCRSIIGGTAQCRFPGRCVKSSERTRGSCVQWTSKETRLGASPRWLSMVTRAAAISCSKSADQLFPRGFALRPPSLLEPPDVSELPDDLVVVVEVEVFGGVEDVT